MVLAKTVILVIHMLHHLLGSDIYHYPSCPSANQINQVNLVSFSSANVAVTAGYRPCLICVPPLGVFINNPPLIVLSEQSKTQLNVNTGFVYVSVRVVASDETRDIKYLSCSSYDPSGHLVDSKDLDVSEYMPSTVDTRWSVKIDTSKIGVHTIKADAYDSRNQKAIASAYVVVQ